MIARCGRCGATIEVSGAGRFQCPACGTTNQVSPAASEPPTVSEVLPPVDPAPPAARVRCPGCDFEFIVGEVDSAICPNCREEVTVDQ